MEKFDSEKNEVTDAKKKKSSTSHVTRKGKIFLIAVGCILLLYWIGKSTEESVAVKPTKQFDLLRDTAYDAIVAKKSQVDANEVKKLSKLATFKTDDFTGVTWIKPKDKPAYRNQNGIYCYFAEKEGSVSNFRLVIQYFADDWLFIKGYRFVIDRQPFTYIPDKVERDNADGDIWEWSDEPITGSDRDLVLALSAAKSAKMRFEGSQYFKEKTITSAQLKSIKNMVNLYMGMGGRFY